MKKIVSLFAVAALIACMMTSCGMFAKSNYVKGTFDKEGFKSEFLNLEFEAPKDYKMATQKELDKTINEALETTDANIDYAKANLVYEMSCSGEDDIPVVYVVCERATNAMKLETYIDNFITGFKSTADGTYEDYKISDVKTKKFADDNWQFLSVKGTVNDVEMIQDIYFKKVEDRMVTVQFIYTKDYPVKDLVKGFSKIK